ncbi:S-layer family protein, partial [Aneurinibacillus soli]
MSKKIYKEYYKVLSTTVIFSMLFGSSHTIAAPAVSHEKQPQKKVSASSPFLDFDQVSDWAKESVLKMKEQTIMVGDPVGRFRPLDKMTRQEMAATLSKVLNLTKQETVISSFNDVSTTTWAKDAIDAVKVAGIMKGDEKGNFHPNAPLTQEEFASLLINIIKADTKGKGNALPFADKNQISSWAKPAVQVALEEGLLHGDGKNFNPKKPIQRQEVASVISKLMDLIAPSSHHAVIDEIKGNIVTINGISYRVAENVKGVLNEGNADVLQHAKIDVESSNQVITKITYLELKTSGKPAKIGGKEFSENIVLDAQGTTIDGNIKVGADYVTIKNLTIAGNFDIEPDMKNNFYAYKVEVKGNTTIEGGSPHTVVFEDSTLQATNINKPDVRVEAIGTTTVSEINVTSNATIQADSSITIPKVNIQDGATNVTLNASITSLSIENHDATTLSGSGKIESLTIQNASFVTLNTSATITQVTVSDVNSKVTVQPGTQIGTLSVPTGAKVENIVTNYTEVKSQIASTSAGVSPSTTTSSGSGSSGSNHAPTATTIANQTIMVGSGDLVIDLNTIFSDQDGDVLSFTAVSQKPLVASVNLSEAQLKITPLSAGSTIIAMSANDGRGGKVSKNFTVTVQAAANHAPTVANPIGNQTMTVGGSPSTISLGNVFADADGDTLMYGVSSSDTGVANVSTTGDQLTITPIAAGTATITVTANDGHNAPISSTFTVTVQAAANQAPTVANPIGNQTMTVGGSPSTISLGNVFADADGDTLIYGASSSDTGVANVSTTGDQLTITPIAAGTATITVTANDGHNAPISSTFTVTVQAATNHAPTVANPIGNQTMTVGGSPSTISLGNVFADADGDTLMYGVSSSDTGVANVSTTGDQLTITPIAAGTATITVTANDGHNAPISS